MSLLIPAVHSVDTEYSPSEISDETLVSKVKSGDTDAFVELIKRNAAKVFQVAYRVTRNRQDAEDALQDSFLKAFIHMKDFEERSSFRTWLTRIAINSALMILRKKRIRPEISIDSTDDPVGNFQTWEPKSPWEDPESRYIRRERQKLLRHAIHQLPAVFHDVVQLRHARECSGQEIAQSLGITVPAVKSRLARAKRALHTSLLQTDSKSPS
jgi:RNA polymerase sigma-70 factor (ECF subfamily)